MSLKVWRNAPAVLVAFLNCAILVTAQDPSVSGSSEPPAGLGARNAINYPGVDIGAKINAAFAACEKKPCTVSVPPGDYHYKTTIVLPSAGFPSLQMDNAAFLHYDGDGRALSTSMVTGRVFIRGGHIYGNPAAKVGIILLPLDQGVFIDNTEVENFTQGDGILDLGANVVKMTNIVSRNNMFGVHIAGSPGYASNSVTISNSTIILNSRWGIIDGDMTQFPPNWMGTGLGPGVTSPELGNVFINNDLEGNGLDPSGKYGAVLEALTYKSVYSGNYFEASPHHQIQIGCQRTLDPVYQRLYGVIAPTCGTSKSVTIRDNYFTSGAPIEIELMASVDAVIDANAEQGAASNCFASVTGSASGTFVSSNHIDGSRKANGGKGEWLYCRGSGSSLTEGWPNQNAIQADLNLRGGSVYLNHQGPDKETGQQMIRYAAEGPPAGFCSPTWSPGAIWMNTTNGRMFVCQSDTIAPRGGDGKNAKDGQASWVPK
jgi:hypothetical protein